MPAINDFLNNKSKEEKEIKFDNVSIKVKQYLPVNDKLKLINSIISLVAENDYDFLNPIQLQVYNAIEIIRFYTDIELEDELNIPNTYDNLIESGLYSAIIEAIPQEEYDYIIDGIYDTVEAFYNYHNSVLGIMKAITQDYSNLNMEASEIQQKIANPENLGLLKEVVKNFG